MTPPTIAAAQSVSIAGDLAANIAWHQCFIAAAQQGADLYAAGVLITENGYAADTALLQGYARTHSMAVLMANHVVERVAGSRQDAARSGRRAVH